MIAAERRNTIKNQLLKNNSVKVSDLVNQFNVSEETIRRDLNQLEKEGFLEKNYGGAILVNKQTHNPIVLPLQDRHQQFFKEKELIGKKAAELIEEDQTIILDAGTTTWHVTTELAEKGNLTIITNAMNIAEKCTKNEIADIYLLGGKLRRNSLSTVGPQAEAELKKYNANYVFLGTSGISFRQGFTSSDLYEAEMKKAMVSAGHKRVVLADHSKLQKAGLTSFCTFEDIDIFITSDLADKQILDNIAKAGVEVIVVSTDEESWNESE
ncbi:DeoR/GlpR family DNA-binding transcription regulator [Virgibacillus siamensis]|uniref:DeoR/GlpR family DNA-binding transcription regulator n=1 Tax=Virgibacillus siamensis TaxID=480071 RepID=UPI000984B1B8|nr:DeoR/GlpR family DNA-binding transcription regulator [Virgibacillus siamensis]